MNKILEKTINSQSMILGNSQSAHAEVVDAVISPGLSVHHFGSSIGVYCDRLDASKGFVEIPIKDLIALVDFFTSERGIALLPDRGSIS
jgi:hypothetical protein